ncbi:type VI secretion protein [Pseudomonas kribbensis]|uniref:Type VI secretion protein n=1 Tax=Pseudomonas kribbensis TaxID=1628086 RepID=A0A345RJV2_9PSED|nr:contractile injection system protein, VgrG/Pvc8 family [Pseudomonas kribbensis]AXI59568.1 type VI secretion protein [Pseudomonas kribbensis]
MFDPAHEPSFRLDVAGLSAPLEVLAFTGCEAISEPFSFEVDLLIDDPHLDLAGLLYRSARLCFGPPGNGVHGQLQGLVQHEHGDGVRLCRARLGPKLGCLGLRHNQRMFSGRSVPQILDHVLREHGITGHQRRFELQADHPPRRFCTQYGESDLQLVQRLCAQSRIHYHFEHGRESHCLVFGDNPARLPRAGKVPFDAQASAPAVRRWLIQEQASGASEASVSSRTAQGHSDEPTLRSGRWLNLSPRPFAGCDTHWLLTRIEHRAGQMLEPPYSCRLRAVDGLQACGPVVERPVLSMGSLQRAWVVAVDEPQPDRSRPVAVQFDWLYQGEGATPSHCWLPLAPALADAALGSLHEGVEVVVSFIEGDPEQPVISGVLQPAATAEDHGDDEPLPLPDTLASEGLAPWLSAREPLLLLCLMPGGGSYRHCRESVCSCRLVAGLSPGDGR